MSTELIPLNQKVSNIRQLLEKSKSQIKMALPSHLSPDRMLRIAMTSIQKNPALLNCTPQSLIGAIIQTSQLGLEPDGILGHAYLIPYGNVCTFIPGYKGLVQLARRSGDISTIMAEVVHANDVFDFELGLDPKLKHIPTDAEEEGDIVAFYAVAKLKDGGVQFTVMRKTAIERIRKRSKAGNSGPWQTDYEEMGKKTVIRRLCKLLPCSVELEKAVALDERAEVGLPQDLDVELGGDDSKQQIKAASKLDQLVPPRVEGEDVDAKTEQEDPVCDKSDWDHIEIACTENGVRMKDVKNHIEKTMGFVTRDQLTKSRLQEVHNWILANKKS